MPQALNIGKQKQLFIDDYCVAATSGVHRQLNQPKKHAANPLLKQEKSWEENEIGVYGNVIFDPEHGHYRMWYSSRSSEVCCICHATSQDGVHWERSDLGQFEHNGMPLSNVVLEGQYVGPTVFYTPEDPDPQRKYRMFLYMGPEILRHGEKKTAFSSGYGVIFSPDGFHWTAYESNPVVQGGDISTCSYDPVSREYVAYPKMGRIEQRPASVPPPANPADSPGRFGRRCTGVTTSRDFMLWDTPNIILSADAEDDARAGARLSRFRSILSYDDPEYYSADLYGMTGFRYEGLRLGLIWFYDRCALTPDGGDDGVINIQLAYSRDLNAYGCWDRAANREDFLSCGGEGSYDAGMVITAHTVVEVEDELWFYYTGYDRGHGWEGYDAGQPRELTKTSRQGWSINLATLRRDGFVSMEALHPGGTLTTKPIVCAGDELEINADAENGEIVVEILDEAGQPITGFGRNDCQPFTHDAVKGKIAWKNGRTLATLEGRTIQLVFLIKTAKLYAFKFN